MGLNNEPKSEVIEDSGSNVRQWDLGAELLFVNVKLKRKKKMRIHLIGIVVNCN